MYTFSNSVVETVKTFCMSFLCSAFLAHMLYRENVRADAVVCLILNSAAFILFLFLYFKNWSRNYNRSFTPSEYIIPATISFSVYVIVSTLLYMMASFAWIFPGLNENPDLLKTIQIFYKYFFQHSRFLEPKLKTGYDFGSPLIAQLITLGILIFIPISNRPKK